MARKYDLLTKMVEAALADFAERGHSQVKGAEIKAWAAKNRKKDFAALESSWNSYLSQAADDPSTNIERVPGQYLWQLASPGAVEKKAKQDAEAVDQEPSEHVSRERRLYPAVIDHWLLPNNYRAGVTADMKGGGVWGNPDVTGLKVISGVGDEQDIELATVEVKLGTSNWKRDFFQAVSHKRFAQRVYFAFGYPTDSPVAQKVADSTMMREYGEKFRVGVLAICMNEAAYKDLTEGPAGELNLDEVVVLEIWPAVYDPVTLDARTQFVRGLKIVKSADVHKFGKALEET